MVAACRKSDGIRGTAELTARSLVLREDVLRRLRLRRRIGDLVSSLWIRRFDLEFLRLFLNFFMIPPAIVVWSSPYTHHGLPLVQAANILLANGRR